MTCPECRDTGMITRPYIAGVVSVMSPCHCPIGRAVVEHINKQMDERNGSRQAPPIQGTDDDGM